MRNFVKCLLVCMMAALMLLTVGCDKEQEKSKEQPQQKQEQQKKPEQPQQKPADEKVTVKLYYPTEDAEKLKAVELKVPAKDKYKASVEALIAGTKQSGLIGIFPKGVKLRSVNVKDGLATVDFTKELTTRFVGGSTGEEMLVGSLVNTLTEFPEVTSVLILVEGKEIDTISGHLDTSVPFKRMGELL
ncbi:MAG: spore gernimation protein [Schwartzia succinivorans]|uniref:GerMN domain-containing protein n=1 Tax=Schwartzia succinivorans TaxID=55507 RepID=UPI002357765E|nr:GerMN domain-containing protein [Schwartzia succinivorans]MBE6096970.1 spore gernimation protein [Schwartzia succinivorans]